MERKTLLTILFTIAAGMLFIAFSALVRDTAMIWYETRLFGLVAFVSLFLTVVIGEIRVLAKNKAQFKLFRFHKPIAIFATFLVGMHFVAAALDNFKWGKGLPFLQYLGFSFSDKWLIFLSFGTLAFYLMLLVGLTSRTKSIQKIGYKNWKLIHYFSYISFIFAYVHSVNLGTDIKTSVVSPVLSVAFPVMFLFIIALLFTRVLNAFPLFADQWEVNLAAIFFLLMLLGGALLGHTMARGTLAATAGQQQITTLNDQINAYQTKINAIQSQNDAFSAQLQVNTT